MRIVEVPGDWVSSLRIVADVTSEDVDRYLTLRERADLELLRVPLRRLERAASRIAGKILLDQARGITTPSDIEFLKQGDRPTTTICGGPAPFSVSFTHSVGFGAAAAGDTPVGVDLERFREIRREMTRFFLSPGELASADAVRIEHPLLHFWSAKEAVFKMTGAFPTLLGIPLEVVGAGASGVAFRVAETGARVETRVIETSFIVALATQTGD